MRPVARCYSALETPDEISPMRRSENDMKAITDAFQHAAALDRYERPRNEGDLRIGVEASRVAIEKLELAYDCVKEDDTAMSIL